MARHLASVALLLAATVVAAILPSSLSHAIKPVKDAVAASSSACSNVGYGNKALCLKTPGCEYCAGDCVSATEGTCCPAGNHPCDSFINKYCSSGTTCVRSNTSLGDGVICSVTACCAPGKEVCANSGCYDPSEKQCCLSGYAAPLDAQCCMNTAQTQSGAQFCPKGKSCCVGNSSSSQTPTDKSLCCDDETEICHTTLYGNFCAKKNQTNTTCSDSLGELECLLSGGGGCQFCMGRCMKKSAGQCCTVSKSKQCSAQEPFGALCNSSSQVCALAEDHSRGCTKGECCPVSKPLLCLGQFGKNCYNNATEQCCFGDVGPKSALCCKQTGLCRNPKGDKCCGQGGCYDSNTEQCCHEDVGPKDGVCCPLGVCPSGSTCCGQTTIKACCNSSYPVCDDNHFYNKCKKD